MKYTATVLDAARENLEITWSPDGKPFVVSRKAAWRDGISYYTASDPKLDVMVELIPFTGEEG